jgi:Family of unknown function (DUF5675)
MEITVTRQWFTAQSTQGILDIDGVFVCYAMEPRKDQSQGKPYCIPTGRYQLVNQWSNHFQRVTPHVQNVPGFTEIELHPGNFPRDTEGCTLVGTTRYADVLGQSDAAFDALMPLLNEPDMWITYTETSNV